MDDVTESIEPKRGRPEQRSVLSLVCGKNVKKYRMKAKLVERLNVNDHQIRQGIEQFRVNSYGLSKILICSCSTNKDLIIRKH